MTHKKYLKETPFKNRLEMIDWNIIRKRFCSNIHQISLRYWLPQNLLRNKKMDHVSYLKWPMDLGRLGQCKSCAAGENKRAKIDEERKSILLISFCYVPFLHYLNADCQIGFMSTDKETITESNLYCLLPFLPSTDTFLFLFIVRFSQFLFAILFYVFFLFFFRYNFLYFSFFPLS